MRLVASEIQLSNQPPAPFLLVCRCPSVPLAVELKRHACFPRRCSLCSLWSKSAEPPRGMVIVSHRSTNIVAARPLGRFVRSSHCVSRTLRRGHCRQTGRCCTSGCRGSQAFPGTPPPKLDRFLAVCTVNRPPGDGDSLGGRRDRRGPLPRSALLGGQCNSSLNFEPGSRRSLRYCRCRRRGQCLRWLATRHVPRHNRLPPSGLCRTALLISNDLPTPICDPFPSCWLCRSLPKWTVSSSPSSLDQGLAV